MVVLLRAIQSRLKSMHRVLVIAAVSTAAALDGFDATPTVPNPRIIGGWTNCPPTCAESCVPPLGPQKTSGGDNMTKAACEATCKPDGSGQANPCNALDMGVPHTKEWGPAFGSSWGATAILPGKFGGTAVAPVEGDIKDYPYRWVTVGGAGTSSGNWQETAESDILDAGALGAAFDEEGGVTAKAAAPWILKMRKKYSKWTFVYVPQVPF